MEEALIEGVREFPCLWQVSSRSYKDLRAKENAWKEVAKKVGEGLTAEDCIKKWRTLRDKFVREFKKVKKRKSGEEGPVYVSCWPLYPLMEFIADTVKHRTGTSNLASSSSVDTSESQDITHGVDYSFQDQGNSSGNSSNVDNDLRLDDNSSSCTSSRSGTASPEDALDTDRSNETPPMSDKKRKCIKRSRNDDIDELLVKSLISLQEKKPKTATEDEEGLFGKQVAATLRRFTHHQKAMAKLQIQQILTTIEFPVDSANFMSPYSNSATPY